MPSNSHMTTPNHPKKRTLDTALMSALEKAAASAILASISTPILAALPNDALLDFDPGVTGGYYGFVTGGSYFGMGSLNPPDRTGLSPNEGVIIGTAQPASGSHGGAPDGSESPGIDLPWGFFNNTGMHLSESAVTATDINSNTQELDMSGWRVTWNGIASINMGGGIQDCGTSTDGICVDGMGTDIANIGGIPYNNGTGMGTLTCDIDCSDGDGFTLDYQAVVPQADPSNFGGVPYFLKLTGTIVLPGSVTANDDAATTITDNSVIVAVTENDTVGAEGFQPGSVIITSAAVSGTAIANADNTVTYTPNNNFNGIDSFQYTVASALGSTSNEASVTIDAQTNQPPVAGDDSATISTAILDATPLVINVLNNDTDPNNAPGLPGGIDVSTVAISNSAGNIGVCTVNLDGSITYSQPSPSVGAQDTCFYTVSDIDSSNPALSSNTATVDIQVEALVSDWPTVLPANTIPILEFEPGNGGTDQSIMPDQGSWFSMQISASQLVYTNLAPGPDGGIIVGTEQPATGSHTGAPNETEQPGVTAPWVFFSNTGFDFTRNGGISNNGDGTLLYRDKFVITWNGIGVINLGGSSEFPEDLGFATITCSDKPCQHGSDFVLDYAAHVEDVDGFTPSGFNGVPYAHHLEGTVQFLDGSIATTDGSVSNQVFLSASDVPSDPEVDLQCAGGCIDYTIDGVTPGSQVTIVIPLQGGVPNSPVWRILDNGTWRDFDTTGGDSVKTAPMVTGSLSSECPPPGDAEYIDLVNESSPNVGHQCVQLAVRDNGLNDLNDSLGTIEDPSGFGTAGAPVFVDNRGSGTSGCTLWSSSPRNGIMRYFDWWLIGAFLGWLGWTRRPQAK